jgi:hypothetical protein
MASGRLPIQLRPWLPLIPHAVSQELYPPSPDHHRVQFPQWHCSAVCRDLRWWIEQVHGVNLLTVTRVVIERDSGLLGEEQHFDG